MDREVGVVDLGGSGECDQIALYEIRKELKKNLKSTNRKVGHWR